MITSSVQASHAIGLMPRPVVTPSTLLTQNRKKTFSVPPISKALPPVATATPSPSERKQTGFESSDVLKLITSSNTTQPIPTNFVHVKAEVITASYLDTLSTQYPQATNCCLRDVTLAKDCFSSLLKLRYLRELDFRGLKQVSKAEESLLDVLQKKQIQKLRVNCMDFSPSFFQKLVQVKSLKELDISYTPCTGEAFILLVKNLALSKITLNGCDIPISYVMWARRFCHSKNKVMQIDT